MAIIDINIPIEDAVTDGSLNPVTSNAVFDALATKANSADLGETAFSNNYNDLDNLPTIPSVTGFVPYTGATNDVDLGVHDLTATQGTFATSGNPDTLTVNHSSGSGKALTITKGGNGEGVYVNKTSGSGNAVTIIGDLEATNLKRTGGTSSQFLKANGSIDSTSYQPTLVSGTNIKTVNGTSLLGSGDITIGGGGLTVGTTAVTSGTDTRVFFQQGGVLQQDANFTFNNTQKRLTLRAVGTASTDIPLIVRNSADTLNLLQVSGNGVSFNGPAGTAFSPIFALYRNNSEVFRVDEYKSQFTGSVYMNTILGAGTAGIIFGNQSGSGKLMHMSPTLGTFSIGYSTVTTAAALDIKAQGALSTDIAFRVRNSADSANLFQVNGNNSIYMFGDGDTGSIRLMRQTGHSSVIQHRSSGTLPSIFTIGTSFSGGSIGQIVFDCQVGDGTYSTFTMHRFISGMTDLTGSSLQSSFGANNTACFTMKNSLNYQSFGSIPTTTPIDHFAMYSADIVAGNAAPHFRTENGSIIKLYKETTAVAASTFAPNLSGILNDSATFDGYTIGQVVKALRNLGILA